MATSYLELGLPIKAAAVNKYLTDGVYVKGGYCVVADITERDGLPVADSEHNIDGIVTEGSMVYCKSNGKTYVCSAVTYSSSTGQATATWVESSSGSVTSISIGDTSYTPTSGVITLPDSIGGRNYLLQSQRNLENGSSTDSKTLFTMWFGTSTQNSDLNNVIALISANISEVGHFKRTWTLSSDISASYLFIKHNGSTRDFGMFFDNPNTIKAGVYTLSFDVEGYNPSVANGLVVKNFKFEQGNIETDWSPAPEDLAGSAGGGVTPGTAGYLAYYNTASTVANASTGSGVALKGYLSLNTGTYGARLHFENTVADTYFEIWRDAANQISWGYCNGSTHYKYATMDSSGNFGIGITRTSPTAKLDVDGTAKISTALYVNDVESTDNNGLLSYHPSNWTGVSSTQWGVGAVNSQGVIRSSASDLIHYRGGIYYTILDTSNGLPLTGGTITNTAITAVSSGTTPTAYRNLIVTRTINPSSAGNPSYNERADFRGIDVTVTNKVYGSGTQESVFAVYGAVVDANGNESSQGYAGYFKGRVKTGSLSATNITSSGVISSSGSITAPAVYQTSDDRLKDYKGDFTYDINKIDKIPTRYFEFKNDETKKIHIGTSAQAVQEVLPQIVNEGEDGYLSVDYSKLSLVALDCIKQLKAEISALKQEISELKK